MDDYITRLEHDEFAKRMEESNKRQDKRIELLEDQTKEINALTVSVGKLATSIESMVKEQEQQGERLELLEKRDGEMWRSVTKYVVTAIVGALIGYIFTKIGM